MDDGEDEEGEREAEKKARDDDPDGWSGQWKDAAAGLGGRTGEIVHL